MALMGACSGTPRARKLDIDAGAAVLTFGAPGSFGNLLAPLPTGLVDNKMCAIDDTWSGLRLVRRKVLPGLT